jgi:hypothetical protein
MTAAEIRTAALEIGRASNDFGALDPVDLDEVDEALRARAALVSALSAGLARLPRDGGPELNEAAAALAEARELGAELLLRLRLVRSGLRTELDALAQHGQMLHTLAPENRTAGGCISCDG